jgi:hypothetical protein
MIRFPAVLPFTILKSSSRLCGPRRLIKNVAAGLAVEIHEYTGGAQALVAYNQDQISW